MIKEQPCGCIVQYVEAGEIVVRFCTDHLIGKDPFGAIPRMTRPVRRPDTTDRNERETP